MKYTLIAVDPVKKHVTFEMEDGIRQTVCDFPVDDAVALEGALARYAANYHSPEVEEKPVVPNDIKAMIGQEKQVVEVKVDSETKGVMVFDAGLSMEDVKTEVVESVAIKVEEATIVGNSIEIVSVKPESVAEAAPIEAPVEVVAATPVEEAVVVEDAVEEAPVA